MLPDPSLRETMLRSEVTVALIGRLQAVWPEPVDLHAALLDMDEPTIGVVFVDAVQGLVDEGLVMIDALLIGTAKDPVARQAVLTRKGATVLHHVTRPM